MAAPEDKDELDPAIRAALDEVLDPWDDEDTEMMTRLRALIENCLRDNYDQSDVRSVIDLAMVEEDVVSEDGDDA